MAWFLALQGPPNRTGQSVTYELHESANVHQIEQEMTTSVTIDRAVAIPTIFRNRREVTLYVRPAAWGAWAFFEMSEEERRQLAATNPVANTLGQAVNQQQAASAQQAASQQQAANPQQARPPQAPRRPQGPQGPSVLPRLDANQEPFLMREQE
jgi:hypothetical protein